MEYNKSDKSVNKNNDLSVQTYTCSICFDECYEKNILKTKCNHYFHSECLFNWMIQRYNKEKVLYHYDDVIPLRGSCPMCRNKISQIFDLTEHKNYKPTRRFNRFYFF